MPNIISILRAFPNVSVSLIYNTIIKYVDFFQVNQAIMPDNAGFDPEDESQFRRLEVYPYEISQTSSLASTYAGNLADTTIQVLVLFLAIKFTKQAI